MSASGDPPWSRETFYEKLRVIGESRYHDKHPFHSLMNTGQLNPEQLRGWVANRFYYQRSLPQKDAAILANCPYQEVRRLWLHRITDHDGRNPGEGGIEAWLRLAEAVGLPRDSLQDNQYVLPAVREAVDAYVEFARTQPWPIAVASSLTELFAPDLMADRLAAFQRYYPWIPDRGLEYFRSRISRARIDSKETLELTITHCHSRELQQKALDALTFKCDILWAMLDAILDASNLT